jgi:hypothetical protein
MSGPLPAASHQPDSAGDHRLTRKVVPISFRYRQQINQQIHLPLRQPNGSFSAGLTASAPPVEPDERAAFLPSGTVLVHLLLRLQL